MLTVLIKQIPNTLTTLRLCLALPICLFILDGSYQAVLWVALIAGISDGLDGWLARRLDAQSRYGSIVDPLSDKVMLTGTYVSLMVVGLFPWWATVIVVLRDLLIVSGALVYHWQIGRYEITPSIWGKVSTFVQIIYALVLLVQQITPLFPLWAIRVGLWLLLALAIISCGHYFFTWGRRALAERK